MTSKDFWTGPEFLPFFDMCMKAAPINLKAKLQAAPGATTGRFVFGLDFTRSAGGQFLKRT